MIIVGASGAAGGLDQGRQTGHTGADHQGRGLPHWAVTTRVNLPSVTLAKCTPPLWLRSTPAYSGTAVRLETPGTTSKSTPPRTQAAASSATALSRNGSPETSRTTRLPGSVCLSTNLAAARGAERFAGLGQTEGRDLGAVGQGDRRMGEELLLALVVQDHRRRVGQGGDGAEGEQIGVARAGADVDDPTRGSGAREVLAAEELGSRLAGRALGSLALLAFCSASSSCDGERVVVVLQLGEDLHARCHSELAGDRRRSPRASAAPEGQPWSVPTSCSVAFSQLRRRESNRDRSPRTPPDLGSGAHRGRAPGLQGGQESSLCKGFRTRAMIIEAAQHFGCGNTERSRNFQCQGALSGCWKHDVRSENLCRQISHRGHPVRLRSRRSPPTGGDRAGSARLRPARPRRPGPRAPADPGVDVAADRHHVDQQAVPMRVVLELHGPSRRAGADPDAVAQAVQRAGRSRRRGCPLGVGTAANSSSGDRAVGRSLSECTATSIRPACRASRTAPTNTPVPPIWVSARGSTSPVVVMPTNTESTPARGQQLGDLVGLRPGQR